MIFCIRRLNNFNMQVKTCSPTPYWSMRAHQYPAGWWPPWGRRQGVPPCRPSQSAAGWPLDWLRSPCWCAWDTARLSRRRISRTAVSCGPAGNTAAPLARSLPRTATHSHLTSPLNHNHVINHDSDSISHHFNASCIKVLLIQYFGSLVSIPIQL